MSFNRDMIWTSNSDPDNVREIKFKDLTNKHLANIIRWVDKKMNDERYPAVYSIEFLDFLNLEADRRWLNDEFLANAPYPFSFDYDSDENLCDNGEKRKNMDRREYISQRISLAGDK